MSDAASSPYNSSISSCSSPSEAASPRAIIASEDLPLPTAPRPFPTKKSHARKQPLGHIPRPRNAFILFRCDYARQNKRMVDDHDQNDVSRTVGTLWRNMSKEQRAPWVVLAEAEKKRHATLYPGYKYTPNRKSRPTEKEVTKQIEREAEKAVDAELAAETARKLNDMVTVYYPPWATRRTLTYFARRAISCPPPEAVQIEPYSESVDRAMVVTNAPPEVAKPAKTASCAEAFVPSAYGILDGDSTCADEGAAAPAGAIRADHVLSRRAHTIDPPGGTSSWGAEDRLSPSSYPEGAREAHRIHETQGPTSSADTFDLTMYGTHSRASTYTEAVPSYADHSLLLHSYTVESATGRGTWVDAPYFQSTSTQDGSHAVQAHQPIFYTQQGDMAMPVLYVSGVDSSPVLSQVERYYDSRWSHEIPTLELEPPSSPSEGTPSPITPLERPIFTQTSGLVTGSPPATHADTIQPTQGKVCPDDLRSGFGTIFQSLTAVYGVDSDTSYSPGVNSFVRESSVRTTYSPRDGGPL